MGAGEPVVLVGALDLLQLEGIGLALDVLVRSPALMTEVTVGRASCSAATERWYSTSTAAASSVGTWLEATAASKCSTA